MYLAWNAIESDYKSVAFTRYFQPDDADTVKRTPEAFQYAAAAPGFMSHVSIHYDVLSYPAPGPGFICSEEEDLEGYFLQTMMLPST